MRAVLEERIELWVADPDSSVVYAEEVEGKWAVRMRQDARDATTVWFTVGERSLQFEAYVIPEPTRPAEVHRQALVRNMTGWRCFYAVDREGALVLRGRLAAAMVTLEELDRVLGEIYEMVEIGFRSFVNSGWPKREKSS